MRVIIAAGGSGGHIFPAVALADKLECAGVEHVHFVSSDRRLDRSLLDGKGNGAYFLSRNPMPRTKRLSSWTTFIYKLISDTVAALRILAVKRPHVVVGFGGYSSGTITAIAALFGIPTVIHEQNQYPGRANILLSRMVDKIAVSFPDSRGYFKVPADRIVHTGNPIRVELLSKDRSASADRLGIDPGIRTVLIMGGSQGATSLNTKASKAAVILSGKLRGDVQFVHLTGPKDIEMVRSFYSENNIKCRAISFLERIDDAYAVSDVVISRSGAAAVFEIAYYGLPMILVPYPNPKNNQITNARYFAEAGAALLCEEKDTDHLKLAGLMHELLTEHVKRTSLAENALKIAVPDAAQRLARTVLDAANKF